MTRIRRSSLGYRSALPLLAVTIVAILMIGLSVRRTLANSAGFALEFNGTNDHVRLGDTGELFDNPAWADTKSISVWVNPTGLTPPSVPPENGEIIAGVSGPRLFGITRAVYNGGDRIWVWNGDSDGIDGLSIDFTPGEWTQIVMVHTGGVLSAYKDGVLVGAIASGPTFVPNGTIDGNLYLGGPGRGPAVSFFSGQIDEARIWNVALDEATISAWQDSELTDAHPNWLALPAYYQMSDAGGTTLSDNSPNSNTGLLLGSMTDSNWVVSGAFGSPGDTPAPTDTLAAPTAGPTETPALPTDTPTITLEPPSPTAPPLTNTPLPPTATPLPPSPTVPSPTNTPTLTLAPPSPTPTDLPPGPTSTPTQTIEPPTPTPTSIPDNPVEVGFYNPPDNIFEVTISGEIAYITGNGLHVLDISDPANPVELSFLDTPGRAWDVALSGDFAYLAGGAEGIIVIDISDPSNPIVAGSHNTPEFAQGIAVAGDLAYVADRFDGLRVLDITAPSNPVEIGFLDTPDQALEIALSGATAYLADYRGGLRVIDITDPTNPQELGSFSGAAAYGIAVMGEYAYLADGNGGLRVLTINNPSQPIEISSLNTVGYTRRVVVQGNSAYVTAWRDGLYILDISDPANPLISGSFDTPGRAFGLDIRAGYAFVADYEAGLRIIDW